MDLIEDAFRQFDEDGNGVISREELAFVLRQVDPEYWDDHALDELLAKADCSGDGKLQYSEFVKWVFGGEHEDDHGDGGQKLYDLGMGHDLEEVQDAVEEAAAENFDEIQNQIAKAEDSRGSGVGVGVDVEEQEEKDVELEEGDIGGEPNDGLEKLLTDSFAYVYRIGGFYVAGTDEEPKCVPQGKKFTGKHVVMDAVKFFGSLLDPDKDGKVDNPVLLDSLAKNCVFTIGAAATLEPLETAIDGIGMYAMSMKTDIWPYNRSYTGSTGWSVDKLKSSMWRPESEEIGYCDFFNALWEEVFHTCQDAWNKTYTEEWAWGASGAFGSRMQADIDAGDYDTTEQNKEENGEYDFETAVTEYLHQIWCVAYGDQEGILTANQKECLELMRKTPAFPKIIDKDYSFGLCKKVK